MTATEISPDQRRRILRTAWLLAGFAAFMFLSSVPFWKGLFNLAMATSR